MNRREASLNWSSAKATARDTRGIWTPNAKDVPPSLYLHGPAICDQCGRNRRQGNHKPCAQKRKAHFDALRAQGLLK